MYFDETNNYFDYNQKGNINSFDINLDNINFNRGTKLYTPENGLIKR